MVGTGMMTPAEIAIAKERGRLMGLEALAANPKRREWMEGKYGLPFMKKRWPELYSNTPVPGTAILMQNFMDRNFGAYGRA